ncbi:MAG: replication restart helicase PriA [Verrucomicrobiales bacterium]
MALVAKVLIDGPSELEFDYAVPESLATSVMAGARVRVPLRARRATGTVTSVQAREAPADGEAFTLKAISSIIEEQPLITPGLLKLARWISSYYCAPLEQVMRSLLPEPVRAENTPFKRRKVAKLARPATEKERAHFEKRAPRQAEVIAKLEAAAAPLPLISLHAEAVQALVKKGLVQLEHRTEERDPHAGTEFVASGPLTLNPSQMVCLEAVLEAVAAPEKSRPLLLFGVTGSGKTEIYLQAVQRVLDQGRTALVLVPEISLTPQTIERFKNRFASLQREVALLHSHLSTGERHDEWHKVARDEARIVVGARSAIFAPLRRLGLIVVDEEHDQSYKQDTVPRYHARDLAVMRAQIEGSAVLLGSATPSLESWRNAQRGKYQLLELPQRVDNQRLPLMRIIDMRLEKRRGDKFAPSIFSEPMRLAIEKRLARSEQVILFLNRRGYAGAIQCPACGHVITCVHCSVSLVFHREPQKLVCHICGYQALPPRQCPSCSDPAVRMAGYGTERVEETLKRMLPSVRLARVDTDSMSRKYQLRDTLNAFQARKIDILVGTQMIAKGLHFPNVTLVGILNADLGLHVPDFRAGERTFQLLTQVAGRAGRGDISGEVIIQTYSPHHAAIQHARHCDFTGYAEQELEFRSALSFPPFAHAVMVTIRSEKENLAEFALKNVHQRLMRELPEDIILGDPVPSPLLRAEDQFRFQLMMRAKATHRMTDHLRAVLAKLSFPREVTLMIDVDPYNLT